MIPRCTQPLLLPVSRARSSLRGVRRAVPALREQGADPQPAGAFLRCRAGSLLPHSCKPFSQASSKISSPWRGPANSAACNELIRLLLFHLFLTARLKPKRFPRSAAPVGAHACASSPAANPCPEADSPRGRSRLISSR